MARHSLLLYGALLVFALMQIGDGLKCYHCDKPPGGECDDPKKNPNFAYECVANDMVCYFQNSSLSDNPKILRGCSHVSQCSAIKGNTTICRTCDKDLCNSSTTITPSFFITSILSVIFAKLYI